MIARWLLSIAALIAVGAAIVWGWVAYVRKCGRENLLAQQAEELAAAKKREEADRVTDAGIAAELRVKEADAKAEKEVQDAVSKPGGLVGYLRELGKR